MPRFKHEGNKRNLVLLTNRFPYNPGEQFLETEILHLAEKFNEIHIIPINMTDNQNPREVPENVIVHDVSFRKGNSASKTLNYVSDVLLTKQGRDWFKEDYNRALSIHPKCSLILLSWLGNALKIKKYILDKFGNDLENYVFYSYWLSTSALSLALLKEDNPVVFAVSRAHRGDLYEYTHIPEYLPLQKKVINNLDQVYVISNDGLNYLTEKHGKEINSKLSIERLGTLPAEGVAKPSSDQVLRIATCSFLSPVKRIPLLIDALKQIHDIQIEWRHLGDGVMRDEIEQLIKELPGNENATILGSLANKEVVKNYLNQPLDLFINVSESEGVPVSIMEAFSCGIPVIATNVGGTAELVNQSNGVLVQKDVTASQLAETIKDFYSLDNGKKEKLRSNAWSMWNETYSADKNYQRFTQLLLQKDQ